MAFSNLKSYVILIKYAIITQRNLIVDYIIFNIILKKKRPNIKKNLNSK